MVIETTRFGAVEVDADAVITAPRGLIGFPDAQRFVLLEHEPGLPFEWLQSADDPALAFLVVDPLAFFPDYEVEVPEDNAAVLGIEMPEHARILTTVTVRRETREVTTNLIGPLVLGVTARRVEQLVLEGDQSRIRQPLPLVATRAPSTRSLAAAA